MRGIVTFLCDDHYQPSNTTCSVISLVVWWAKLEKNDKVRHNNIMTQMANLLAVATVFIGLWTLFISQGGGGGVIAAMVARSLWRRYGLEL